MTDTLKDLFARAVAAESPPRVDLHRVVQLGRRREYARRSAVVAGVGAVAAATATVVAVTTSPGRPSGRTTVLQPAAAGGIGNATTPAPSAAVASSAAVVTAEPTPAPTSADVSSRPAAPPRTPDPACYDAGAGTSPAGNTAAIPTKTDVSAAVRAAAPALSFKVIDSGPIMELSSVGYATLELMGSVTDAAGPSGIQVQAAAEGVSPTEAADAEVVAAACTQHTYRRSALPGGGVLLAETTKPADKDGYQVVAWTAKGVRIRASAQPWVLNSTAGPDAARTAPGLTVAQLEQIVRSLAAG